MEAQRRARMESGLGAEDALAMRLRRAEEEKQRVLHEFDEKARARAEEPGARETALRERHANAEQAKQEALQQMYDMNRAKAAAYNKGTSRPPMNSFLPHLASLAVSPHSDEAAFEQLHLHAFARNRRSSDAPYSVESSPVI